MYQSLLKEGLIGQQYLFLPQTTSTNTYCKQLFAQTDMPPQGLIVQAGWQTEGKGQMGNTWQAQANKNLTFSCILYPTFLNPVQQFYLNIAVSLSIIALLEEYVANPIIKWPNDIYVERKKICGILIENNLMGSTLQSSIVGIGINVNQDSFAGLQATSLYIQNGIEYSLPILLQQWCRIFNLYYQQLIKENYAPLINAYHKRLWGMGQKVAYHQQGQLYTGIVLGVTATGQLMIDEGEMGITHYNFKEITFVI